MRLISSSTFIVTLLSPLLLVSGTADFTISRINLINNTPQISVRFLEAPVEHGHETDPIPFINWRELVTLDGFESQTLTLQRDGDLYRFALYGQIPAGPSPLGFPLFQVSSSSSCYANFTATSPHFSVAC